MFIHVVDAKHICDHKVWLSFNDGAQGEIDLSSELYGEIFEPLKDMQLFKSFTLEGHTLSWNNGADFAPEFLREHITETDGRLDAHHQWRKPPMQEVCSANH